MFAPQSGLRPARHTHGPGGNCNLRGGSFEGHLSDTKQPARWSGLFVEIAPWVAQAALNAFRRREVRTIEPAAPKPMIIIAQVAGSGTALLIEAIVCTPLYC